MIPGSTVSLNGDLLRKVDTCLIYYDNDVSLPWWVEGWTEISSNVYLHK
jgi:hypothetical protein